MSWDKEAETWDTQPSVQAYSRAAFGSLLEACEARGLSLDGARVLDFGCGTGQLAERMAARAREVVALDASKPMADVLRLKVIERGLDNVRVLDGELGGLLEAPPLVLSEPFDLITCSSVCAFLEDYPAAAAQLASLLSPGGLFVQWDWAVDPDAEEPFGLTPEGITAALAGAGLGDVTVDIGFSESFEGFLMAPLRGVGRR